MDNGKQQPVPGDEEGSLAQVPEDGEPPAEVVQKTMHDLLETLTQKEFEKIDTESPRYTFYLGKETLQPKVAQALKATIYKHLVTKRGKRGFMTFHDHPRKDGVILQVEFADVMLDTNDTMKIQATMTANLLKPHIKTSTEESAGYCTIC